jgi:hypothetical protein
MTDLTSMREKVQCIVDLYIEKLIELFGVSISCGRLYR